MPLAPDRFDYLPTWDRPVIKWPNNARIAFWIAPNIEHYEYTPLSRPNQPDIPSYSNNDFGNRVGIWRMMEIMDRYGMRGCCCLNLATLDHFPEVREAMVLRNWDYMAHGIYNSRPNYDLTIPQERAYWKEFIETVKRYTGKQVKGRLGGGGAYTENTDDLMAEAGCLYHTSWLFDDQPWPVKVKPQGKKFIFVPYSYQINDVVPGQTRDGEYFYHMMIDQFDTLYREAGETGNGRVMCISLHPLWSGRPNRSKYLDMALEYILKHDGIWKTTADDIADYYIANYYDKVVEFIDQRKKEGLIK